MKKENAKEKRFKEFVLTILKNEELLNNTPKENVNERADITEILLDHYDILNDALKDIAEKMNYPDDMKKCDDTQPLYEMTKIFPYLALAKWYQFQLLKVVW